MLSVEDIAVVKIAVEICNNPELKREILCAPGSDYDINKGNYQYGSKKQWNEIIEKKATIILRKLDLPKKLQEKVMGIVPSVGMRMLTWAEYHEGTLGFLREYSVNFLNSSFFTQQGIIDNKKAAEELMKDESLNIKQKYKLACLYCLTDHIPALYRQMTKEEFYDTERPQRISQSELVKFWSYHLMGEIDKLKGEKNLDQYRLEKAVESGSKAAVEYCLERTNLRRKKDAIVDAAVEAVKCRVRAGPYTEKDRVVFRNQRYKDSEESWVPSDYYVDILSFLLSKMGEDQQIEFLKQDIKGAKYKRESFGDQKRSRVLEYFLNWPYQDYFMEKAKLMWEFLPERDYAVLLLRICDKIESKEEHLKYGEGKSYDYRGLLRKFWCQSPERYKRYVFSNQEVTYRTNEPFETKTGVGLLIKLLTFKNFTYEDGQNIGIILASATGKEKENIISSKEWRNFCIGLIKEEKWETLNRFVLSCFSYKEEADKFKRELIFTKEALHICIDFVKNDKWNAAELFIKWSSLPEEEINKLKKEMIYSEDGRDACVDLISPDKKVKAVDQFIRWCFSSEEEVKAFRKELVFSYEGVCKCVDLVTADQLELVSEFINFCLSSEGEVRELKKNVAYRRGSSVCERLISDYSEEDIYDEQGYYTVGRTTKFNGGKWEEVEKFLTWCFSSEEEISDFKKNVLLKESGKEIHFNLIKSNQWKEAETFFAWLGLSAEEIKKLKKETLFNYDAASEMFSELMYSEEGDEEFVDYGSKQEAIELLLRWYLTDKETVLEFKDEFKRQYYGEVTEKRKAVFENFDLMIEQRLKDLDKEQKGVKRKSETFSPNKRLCNLKLEDRGAEYGK
ncbi:hypothetical protein [Wolbachia endosymbiont of Oedothorax gibbosus]|uniref:hypothetical protein n=1 Tax=Wolbachia endosymbiont of Oedothorax gibbosus TaxID=931100 RepID=UPI0020248767|nr:hypothetical protein [Wolbachia endosymbiont of Oedothorax gibbosus]